MSVITSIKPQKNKKRVNIYLDGKYGFGLDLETFMKSKLKVEDEITENEVQNLLKKNELNSFYEKLLRYVTIRPRSRKEVDYWFKKHKVHKSLQPELFEKLEHLKLVGDKRFAQWWVEQRMQFKPRSKREFIQELRIKGIDKNVIEEVLGEANMDEGGQARKLLEKKMYRWERLDKFTRKQKMSEFLARKGYSWDVIKEVVKEILD